MSSINKHVIPVINVALKRAVGIRLKTRFSLDARVHIGYLTPEIEKNDVSSAKTFSPVEFEYKVWNYLIDNSMSSAYPFFPLTVFSFYRLRMQRSILRIYEIGSVIDESMTKHGESSQSTICAPFVSMHNSIW